jgi:hypothetical protein
VLELEVDGGLFTKLASQYHSLGQVMIIFVITVIVKASIP